MHGICCFLLLFNGKLVSICSQSKFLQKKLPKLTERQVTEDLRSKPSAMSARRRVSFFTSCSQMPSKCFRPTWSTFMSEGPFGQFHDSLIFIATWKFHEKRWVQPLWFNNEARHSASHACNQRIPPCPSDDHDPCPLV